MTMATEQIITPNKYFSIRYNTKQELLEMIKTRNVLHFAYAIQGFKPYDEGDCLQLSNVPGIVSNIPSLFEHLQVSIEMVIDIPEDHQLPRRVIVKFADAKSGNLALSLIRNINHVFPIKVEIFRDDHYDILIEELGREGRSLSETEKQRIPFRCDSSQRDLHQVKGGGKICKSKSQFRRSQSIQSLWHPNLNNCIGQWGEEYSSDKQARDQGIRLNLTKLFSSLTSQTVAIDSVRFQQLQKSRVRCRVESRFPANNCNSLQKEVFALKDSCAELCLDLEHLNITPPGSQKTMEDAEPMELNLCPTSLRLL